MPKLAGRLLLVWAAAANAIPLQTTTTVRNKLFSASFRLCLPRKVLPAAEFDVKGGFYILEFSCIFFGFCLDLVL